MLRTNSKKVYEKVLSYIVNDGSVQEHIKEEKELGSLPDSYDENNPKNICKYLYDDFMRVMDHRYYRDNGIVGARAFAYYASGLPFGGLFCYYYNVSAVDLVGDILEESEEEKARYSEEDAEKLLSLLIYRVICKKVVFDMTIDEMGIKVDFNCVTYNQDEKYLLISFLRVLGVDFNVSGYYEGYYIGFKCEENQEKEIENFLRLFEDRYTFKRELISEGAILRDYVDIAYTYSCKLHEMVTDIADSLYNVGLSMKDRFLPEYKAIYNFFGADYFAGVLEDMSALDKQIVDPYKVNELLGSYLDRLS